jgi:hypothetical protein
MLVEYRGTSGKLNISDGGFGSMQLIVDTDKDIIVLRDKTDTIIWRRGEYIGKWNTECFCKPVLKHLLGLINLCNDINEDARPRKVSVFMYIIVLNNTILRYDSLNGLTCAIRECIGEGYTLGKGLCIHTLDVLRWADDKTLTDDEIIYIIKQQKRGA